MRRILFPVLLTALVLAFLSAVPAAACPSCEFYAGWTATPCLEGNCSPCGFCAYCCGRFGMGCEHCIAIADFSGAADTQAEMGGCGELDAAAPMSVAPAEGELDEPYQLNVPVGAVAVPQEKTETVEKSVPIAD